MSDHPLITSSNSTDSSRYETFEEPMQRTSKSNDEIIDQIYNDIGTGRYQIYSLIFVVCLISNNAFLLYNVAYFEEYPSFECYNSISDTWDSCTKTEACSLADSDWRVDYTAATSYYNWVTTLNLECEPVTKLGMLGTMLFCGTLVGTIFTPFSDKFGRKPILILNAWG